MMSTRKIITFTIIALLAANLGLLAFIMSKPHHPNNGMKDRFNKDGPKQRMIERLDFDEAQSETFFALVKSHRDKIIKYDDKIKKEKEHLFSLLGKEIPNLVVADSITSSIAAYQKEIELLHFNHFKEIKALCKGDQVEKFNELSTDLSRIFNPKRRKSQRKVRK